MGAHAPNTKGCKHGHATGQQKQPLKPVGPIERWGNYQRDNKRQANGDAHHGHGAGADLLAGKVSQKGTDRSRDCTGTLQGPAQNKNGERVGPGCKKTARSKDQKPKDNDGFAAKTVGGHTERNLEKRLSEPVNAHRQTNGRGVLSAGHIGNPQGKNRKHQEQTEHAQAIDRRQGQAGSPFEWAEDNFIGHRSL